MEKNLKRFPVLRMFGKAILLFYVVNMYMISKIKLRLGMINVNERVNFLVYDFAHLIYL